MKLPPVQITTKVLIVNENEDKKIKYRKLHNWKTDWNKY